MSRISESEVNHIAHLAKLRLEGKELTALTKDFNKIFEFVDQLEEIDTSSVEKTTHVLDHANVRRSDQPESPMSVDRVKQLAVDFQGGFFIVPQVIESDASKTS